MRLRLPSSVALPLLAVAAASLVLTSCKPGRPSGILAEEVMEDILVDYHLAQGMAECSDRNMEEARYLYVQAVFRKHGVSEAEFDSSLVYYSTHSEFMAVICKNVVARVEAEARLHGLSERSGEDSFYANLTADGDTADIWPELRYVTLLPDRVHCLYSFSLQADSTFRPGDSFIWRFRTQPIEHDNRMKDAYAMLRLDYENDSTVVTNRAVMGKAVHDLRLNPASGLDTVPLRRVSGFVYLTPMNGADVTPTVHAMLLHDFSLVRMHKPAPAVPDSTGASGSALPSDSIEHADSLLDDTLPAADQARVRLTPEQMRDMQPREHRINVVKEKPYSPRSNTGRGVQQRRRR